MLPDEVPGQETDSGCGKLYIHQTTGDAASWRHSPSLTMPGSTIVFGTYPQTAEGTDDTPIEWIVLEYDEANHRVLLLSKYGLDAVQYNPRITDITWEECALRAWLNGEFLGEAFSEEEQSAILTTEVDNGAGQGNCDWETTGGNNTQDRIFLLSAAEANLYLGVATDDKGNAEARAATTAYAAARGAWTSDSKQTADGKPAGWWWLRSPGESQHYAALVFGDGSLDYAGVHSDYGVVRPALWVDADAGPF